MNPQTESLIQYKGKAHRRDRGTYELYCVKPMPETRGQDGPNESQ